MTTDSKIKTTHGGDDGGLTYFANLRRTGRLPGNIRAIIDRYNIRIYDQPAALDAVGSGAGPLSSPSSGDTGGKSSSGGGGSAPAVNNNSTNNNDDDLVQSVHSLPAAGGTQTSPPTSSSKVVKLRVPSLTRRLTKFGKRSSLTDKSKAGAAAVDPPTSPSSDSQLTAETTAHTASPSAGTSMTTVNEPHGPSTPDAETSVTALNDEQKNNYQNEQKEEGNRRHLRFNGHFPGRPWLASTRMSPFWILLELRVMEVVTTGAIRRTGKAPVKMSPPTNQHPVCYRPDALPVAQSTVSKH